MEKSHIVTVAVCSLFVVEGRFVAAVPEAQCGVLNIFRPGTIAKMGSVGGIELVALPFRRSIRTN